MIKWNRYQVEVANGRAKSYISATLAEAEIFKLDPKRAERLKASECLYCFERSRQGTTMSVRTNCGICEIEMGFASSATEALCLTCAKANGLCKICGADVELVSRRKPYPFQENENE